MNRIQGDDEASIMSDAAKLAKDLAPPKSPNQEGGNREDGLTEEKMKEANKSFVTKNARYQKV